MINVLQNALNAVSSVYPVDNIEIINKEISYNQGYAETTQTKEATHAYIQPLTDTEANQYANGTLDATKLFKFYILTKKNNQVLISKLSPTQSLILWKNEKYRIFSLNDRTLDGWACCIGALHGLNNDNA